MPDVYGRRMDRAALMRRVGSMEQMAYVRPFTYGEGRANGVKAFDVSNGTGLDFTVLESKGMDMVGMRYKGMNLHYAPKSGTVSPALADMNGTEFMRAISGGMLYTCGLLNVGNACEDEGTGHPFHGRMKTTPAEQISVDCGWEGDEYILRLSGQMREAAIFGDNLVLKRSIATSVGSKSVRIRDVVENQGFEAQQLMLLYHINIGFPILDEGSRLLLPSRELLARDETSEAHAADFDRLAGPIDGFREHVYRHRPAAGSAGYTGAAVVNPRLGLGVYIKYDTRQLPYLVQWKSMRSGDYAIGLMPSTCFVKGRAFERAQGTLLPIAPMTALSFELEIGVIEGETDIQAFEKFVEGL
ncbi:aldose 1-epimerase family protein [Cohnella rhizosphaerae]|uniref:Aldose 1-epimerase family protein n=1 Tax=Cohnella rhizosphaerae TaxID=1457232 RepID=A0A9X4KRX7_9BACL|nr:aldose 1-epimerase family protein [Cohnella rhizosphaerae]MDG0810019.1 aldose 1-epimerase family protein [Cohnella rhizosphaerae]